MNRSIREVLPCPRCGRALRGHKLARWQAYGRRAWLCSACVAAAAVATAWPWPRRCVLCNETEMIHSHHVLAGVKRHTGLRNSQSKGRGVREERASTCIPLCTRCHDLVGAARPPELWGGLAWAAVWTPGVGLSLIDGPDAIRLLTAADLRTAVWRATEHYLTERF